MSEQYGWKFILDDTTDITDKVKSFTIEASLDSFCRELTLDLLDEDFYDTLDFSAIPEEPRIEVFTKIVEDEYDEYDNSNWISQGKFFIERPTFQVGIHETSTGVWGRQSTAILGEPFAQKVTKLWDTDTSFYDICQEIIESVGLTWDPDRCELQDFSIFADNYEADDLYPIEVLKNLVELIVGEEGFITSDRLGNIWIKRLDRAPTTSDFDITDQIVQRINEEPEWPEFGNRIKIIPAETLSQDKVTIYMENQCIGTGAATYLEVYAQVKNGDDVPINDAVVTWSFDPLIPLGLWFKYPSIGKTALQNSGEMLISNELKRATGFNSVELAFEPSSIIGIWAYSDKNRATNFVAEGGYVIDGNTVYITGDSFDFCDQQVYISYYANGMVKNTIVSSSAYTEPVNAQPLYGEASVIASISGREDSKELYVDNSCKCKSTLSVKVDPSSIVLGQDSAKIEAYLENSGVPVSGTIRMTEVGGFGILQWSSKVTSTSETSENTESINVVSGQSQCMVSSAISSVTGVWRIVRDPVTNEDVKTGGNLYSSYFGRTIDLNEFVITGTDLVVEYSRAGSVINYLTGTKAGVSRIDVSVDVSTEEGLVQTVQVTVLATAPGGGGGGGGGTTPVYTIRGPAACRWNPVNNGYLDGYCKYTRYDLISPTGEVLGGTTLAVQGSGYLAPYYSMGFITRYDTPSQTIKITISGNASSGYVSASMDVSYSML